MPLTSRFARQVARAKAALKTNLMLTTATTEGACEDISRQVIGVGRRVPAAELFARIDALSTADVRATANKFINDQVSIRNITLYESHSLHNALVFECA
jgi:predicted Zn-dependent peptidase